MDLALVFGTGQKAMLALEIDETAQGLHVIATEPHGSNRVDRQLFGRAVDGAADGRQSLNRQRLALADILSALLAQPLEDLSGLRAGLLAQGGEVGVGHLVDRQAVGVNDAARPQLAAVKVQPLVARHRRSRVANLGPRGARSGGRRARRWPILTNCTG